MSKRKIKIRFGKEEIWMEVTEGMVSEIAFTMEQEVVNLGKEIERLERHAQEELL